MEMENGAINKTIPIFVVSGGKGVAGNTMVHSLIIQYPDNKIPVKIIPNVQTVQKIKDVVKKVKNAGGLLVHTMVKTELRKELLRECKENGVKNIDFMGPLADFLENDLGLKSVSIPGLYRRINHAYFDRMEAIDYTLNHDDGLNTQLLNKAEIILTGVSRSGKTPLSVYMSMFGWKVANVPLISGIKPPDELFEVDPNRVFGLTINLNQLLSIRAKRISQMGDSQNMNYLDQKSVTEELRHANFIFEKGGFTRINVSNKPIESTANEIIGMVSDRFGYEDRKFSEY
jgi:hypothetical protein